MINLCIHGCEFRLRLTQQYVFLISHVKHTNALHIDPECYFIHFLQGAVSGNLCAAVLAHVTEVKDHLCSKKFSGGDSYFDFPLAEYIA